MTIPFMKCSCWATLVLSVVVGVCFANASASGASPSFDFERPIILESVANGIGRFRPIEVDVGEMGTSRRVQIRLRLSNPTDEELTIGKLKVPCACTSAKLAQVGPKEWQFTIEIHLSPETTGRFLHTVTADIERDVRGQLIFIFKGNISSPIKEFQILEQESQLVIGKPMTVAKGRFEFPENSEAKLIVKRSDRLFTDPRIIFDKDSPDRFSIQLTPTEFANDTLVTVHIACVETTTDANSAPTPFFLKSFTLDGRKSLQLTSVIPRWIFQHQVLAETIHFRLILPKDFRATDGDFAFRDFDSGKVLCKATVDAKQPLQGILAVSLSLPPDVELPKKIQIVKENGQARLESKPIYVLKKK